MAWLLRLLSLPLLGGGGWAVFVGSESVVMEAGAAMLVAGTVALVGGIVVLGLAGVVARLEAIRRILAAAPGQEAAARPVTGEVPPAAAVAAIESALASGDGVRTSVGNDRSPAEARAVGARDAASPVAGGAEPGPEALAPEPRQDEGAPPEPRIVRTFTTGGGTYTMYDDGRIEAVLPEGRLDFSSLEALRRHLDERALTAGR